MSQDNSGIPPITDLGAFGQWLTDPFSNSLPPTSTVTSATAQPASVNTSLTVTGPMSEMSHWDRRTGGMWPNSTPLSSRPPPPAQYQASHLTVPDTRFSSRVTPTEHSAPDATVRYLSPKSAATATSDITSRPVSPSRGTAQTRASNSRNSRSPIRKTSPRPLKPGSARTVASSYPGFVESEWESGISLHAPSSTSVPRPAQPSQPRQAAPPSLSFQLSDGRSQIFDQQTRASCATKARTVWTAKNKLKSLAGKTRNRSARTFLSDISSTFFADTPTPEIFSALPLTSAGGTDNGWTQMQMKKLQHDLSLLEGNGPAVTLLQHMKSHRLIDLDLEAEGVKLTEKDGKTYLTIEEEPEDTVKAAEDKTDEILGAALGKEESVPQPTHNSQSHTALEYDELDFLLGGFF